MKIFEIVSILIIVFIYIMYDLLFGSPKHIPKQHLGEIDRKLVDFNSSDDCNLSLGSKNVWGLKAIDIETKATKQKKNHNIYVKNGKILCVKRTCYEFIAIKNKKDVIMHNNKTKKFITLHKNDRLDSQAKLIQTNKNLVFEDKNHNRYIIDIGFVNPKDYKLGDIK